MVSHLRQTITLIGCLFLCLFLYTACHTKGELQVVSHNFEDEIELQQNLVFLFNKDLCPDSLLNVWDSTEYISFSPAVKGAFRWSGTNELMFSPRQGFMPGTAYTASLTSQLNRFSRKKYAVGAESIKFHTPPLRVMASHLSWTRGKNAANVMVQLDMSFNYDVNLAEAANRLKLTSKGAVVAVSSASSGNGKVLSVQFAALNDKDEETPLDVALAKGIPVVGTNYVSPDDTSFSSVIPSRYNLTITSVTAQHTGSEGVITVSTSQPVLDNNLKEMINIRPSSPVEVTLNDGGFTITGKELSATTAYTLTISSKLEGAFGGKMKGDYSEEVTFGKLEPSISFMNSKGMYLSGQGMKNLALNIVNIPNVEVTVVKVYENNLEQFMRQGSSSNYFYGGDDNSGDYNYYETDNLGDVVYKQKYETAKLPRQNSAHILHLDFEDKIKSYNGVYVLTVKSTDHQWLQQSKILCISDIGLIVKQDDDNVYVFANSIKTTQALPGVKVSFISTNNQVLNTITTDNDGVAVFKNISTQSPGFSVGLVTAKMNDDYSMIMFRNSQIGTSRYDVGGRITNATGLTAMIYPERNLYRPGEMLHISTIVRDVHWNPQPDLPVKIKLSMPNGKEFSTQRKTLNEQGSCDVAFSPPPTTMTGTYTCEVFTGNDVLLNSYEVSIEDFVPDRMKVSLKLDKDVYDSAGKVKATVQADNLFGTPATGRNYECQMNLNKVTFEPDKFPDYDFSLSGDFKFEPILRNDSKTDEKGAAVQEFALAGNTGDAGMLKGRVTATVFDETGRPVHRYGNFTVYTQPVFVGIKCPDYFVSSRQPVHLGLVAVDQNGNAQTANVRVQVVQKYWHTVIQQDGDKFKYVSQSEERIISTQQLTLRGSNTDYIVEPKESGDFEVRVFLPGSNNYVEHTLWAYGWGETDLTSFEVDNEGSVAIKPDKKEYKVGDKVNVLFTTPFEGKLLVTLERDHVIKYYYLTTKDKSASLAFDAGEDHLPNVYVTATLFRPMDASDLPLTVAHGFKSIKVANDGDHLPVDITAVEKSRSKTTQTITIKTVPNAYVTIAAVDEGILQVKNFETPDPYAYFYQKMALTVNSYDIYPWLLPEVKATLSSTGGDGADNSNMRVNPLFVNRIKNVSFWSGILQADGGGNVKYNIDIPQFSGDIRIMALAYKNKGFGSSDKHMKVADPIVISTALPRFLSPKDEVVMPVTVTNTTAKNASATVTLKVTGPLGIKGEATQVVEIAANREQRVVYHINAAMQIGAGKVTVSVRSMNETFDNETDIAVRPAASLQKLTGSGLAAENTITPLDMKNNFMATSLTGKITLGKSPLTEFTKHIQDLVQYPYGCVEQTTSAAFPQLYYGDLCKSLNAASDAELNPTYNVQAAINKLQAMQLGDGGLSYWPSGGYECWWGSVYACHFLMEAKKAGYQVNQNTIDRILEYMKFKLARKEVMEFFYNTNQRKIVAPEEAAYSLYVLALAGKADLSTMNYYKAHPEMLTMDSRYLIGAAYILSGLPQQGKEVIPAAFSGELPNKCLGGSFYSAIRDEALSLDVLLDVDPANKQIGELARQISEQIRHEAYMNTQEEVFSILALGKIARLANKTTSTAGVLANGRNIGGSTGISNTISLKNFASDALSVQVKGKGGYYYFWELDGITADGSYKQEDSYLKVRRTFFDRQGHEINNNTFKQNDLIVVRISIEAQYDGIIDNVAITDMLPAGFEIENTRLTEMPSMDWIKEDATPDYTDIRDDRINMFTSAGRIRKDYYYMVRAVSPGIYQLGPVQADAMYDGNYHSYNGAGVVKIE